MCPSDSEHFSGEKPGAPGILGKLLLPGEKLQILQIVNLTMFCELTLGTKSSSSFVDPSQSAGLLKPADMSPSYHICKYFFFALNIFKYYLYSLPAAVSLINTECVTFCVVGAGLGAAGRVRSAQKLEI